MAQEIISDGGEILQPKRALKLDKPVLIILVLAVVFVFAVGLGIAIAVFLPRKNVPVAMAPVSGPQTSYPTVAVPKSKLASDSAVLQLRSDLLSMQSELDRINLVEPELVSPAIDLGIKIE